MIHRRTILIHVRNSDPGQGALLPSSMAYSYGLFLLPIAIIPHCSCLWLLPIVIALTFLPLPIVAASCYCQVLMPTHCYCPLDLTIAIAFCDCLLLLPNVSPTHE